MDDDASDRGLFATIWVRHSRSWWFRIGLAAVVAQTLVTAFLRGAGWSRDAVLLLGICSVTSLVAIVLIHLGTDDPEALESAAAPRTRGEPYPIGVRFRTPGLGPFGSGEGDIRFLPGMVRFVNWRRDPWDVLVAIAIGLLVAGMSAWALLGVLILLRFVPRRRAIVEDLPIGEVRSVELGADRVVLTTHGGEPFERVAFTPKPLGERRLIAMLRAYRPDVPITAGTRRVPGTIVPNFDASFVRARAEHDPD